MNIINIMIKEIKQNLRDRRSVIIMTIFPIVLMLVLGAALSGAFSKDNKVGEIKVLYTVQGDKSVAESFAAMMDKGKDAGIQFVKADNIQQGIDSTKNAKYSCYILVDENTNTIKLYKNKRYNLEASIVESILNTYTEKYNTIVETAKESPLLVSKVAKDSNNEFVNITSLDKKREPRAVDFYGISMITLIIMYAAMTSASSINGEKSNRTARRMLTAPVRKYEILTGRILGDFIITAAQMAIVILFSKYVIKAYWGESINQWLLILIICSEILMSISIGSAVAFSINNESASLSILNAIIPFMVFLGGGYMPLENFGANSFLITLGNISPVKWVNDAMFKLIYSNDALLVSKAVLLNLVIAVGAIIVSALLYTREGDAA